ncbi:MAG: hypothetical protein IPH04_19495 [Saprospirales bacterium]|nr:hypothetical protein [Saprospirales bacterium]
MPLKISQSTLYACCFQLLAIVGYGQKQQVDFQFPDGVTGYFTVSLQDDGGTEYILQNQIDLSKAPSKTLSLKIQVFFNSGSQGYAFLVKKSGVSANGKVLKNLEDTDRWKRLNQAPISIKFLAVGEGSTNISFDYYYEKDGSDAKVSSFSSKTFTIAGLSGGTIVAPPKPAPNNNQTTNPAPAPKPKSVPGIPEDEQAFKNCGPDDLKCFEQFIRKYPDSQYAPQAKKQIPRLSPLQYEVKESDSNRVRITLLNAVSPQIDTIMGIYSYLDESGLGSNGSFDIKPEPGEVVEVRIVDPGKPRSAGSLTINLQNLLTASLVKDEALFKFFFGGVDPPFLIYLKQDGVLRHKLEVRAATYEITYEDLQKELDEFGGGFGTFDVEAYSDKAGNIVRFPEQISVEPLEKINPLYYLALLIPVILIIGVVQLIQNRKRRKFEALKEKRKAEAEMEPEGEKAMPDNRDPIEEKPAPAAPTQETPPVTSTGTSFNMNIRSVRTGGASGSTVNLSHDDFEAMLKEEACTPMPMDTHWMDSAVTQVHLSRKAIFDLDRFLRAQNIQEIKEKEGTIPEIGGFLLGKYFLHDDQKTYDVAILHFVPVHPEDHDVYRLEFSVESLATKLGDVQDEFPQYALVGWFHTHPGHGLFLSKPDMTIQEGFFNKPFQFAMEIDSLTENLDTAFFTRDLDGRVFNSEHRKPGAKWFAWTEIEKSTRKRRS